MNPAPVFRAGNCDMCEAQDIQVVPVLAGYFICATCHKKRKIKVGIAAPKKQYKPEDPTKKSGRHKDVRRSTPLSRRLWKRIVDEKLISWKITPAPDEVCIARVYAGHIQRSEGAWSFHFETLDHNHPCSEIVTHVGSQESAKSLAQAEEIVCYHNLKTGYYDISSLMPAEKIAVDYKQALMGEIDKAITSKIIESI